jgi:hypothetical protein
MTGADGARESLSADEIDAVGMLWKRQGRQFVTSFSGASMLPAIAPGQRVTVTCGVEPVVGEVVLFRYRDQVGVHRVVARAPDWLLTWGDNNPLPDDPIAPVLVIGAIRDIPARRLTLRRRLLVWFLASPRQPIDTLTHRVQVVYRARTAWEQGLLPFAGLVLRALLRRMLPN